MWMRFPHNPSAFDDDWEDQPAQGWFYKWVLGLVLPAGIAVYGFHVIFLRQAEFSGDGPTTMTLYGINALAYGTAALSGALFLHCHYFWGNIYNQAWFAVLGKIISAAGFSASLIFLCIRIGILGKG
jgi:hypothetical protein